MRILRMTFYVIVVLIMIPHAFKCIDDDWGTGEWRATVTDVSVCALRDSSVVFGCSYTVPTGYHLKHIYWVNKKNQWTTSYSENNLLNLDQYSGRVHMSHHPSNCTLQIDKVQVNDSTSYHIRIEAKKKKEDGITTKGGIDLSVMGLTAIAPYTVTEGQKVTLTCEASCQPKNPPTLEWFRDEQQVPDLFIATVKDAGRYHCAVRGRGDIKSDTVVIEVLYGPKNVTLQVHPSQDILKGHEATFTCNSKANPKASYSLYRKGGQAYDGPTKKIWSIQPSDSGEYYCQARNHIYTGHSGHVTVTVVYPPENTKISVDPKAAVRGHKVNLTCSSDANPPIHTYTWYKGNNSILSSTGPHLVKQNVSAADSGQYICEVQNKHGSQTSPPHHLDVLYPPVNVLTEASPSGNLVEGTRVNLTCSSDANPVANSYTWYWRPPSLGSLVQVGSGQQLSVNLSQTGHYLCQARNSLGGANSTERLLHVAHKQSFTSLLLTGAGGTGFVALISLAIFFFRRKHRSSKVKEANHPTPDDAAEPGGRTVSPSAKQDNSLYANTHHNASPPLLSPSDNSPLYSIIQRPSSQPGQVPSTQEAEVVYSSVIITPQANNANNRNPREEDESVIYSTVVQN